MSLPFFLIQTVIISLSGAMAPGPVTAVTLGQGSRSRWAGTWIAVGHGLVEMPLIAALLLGLGQVFTIPHVQTVIGGAGGAFLVWMGIGLVRSARRPDVGARDDPRSPVLIGALLSAGNPYFLLWWAAVGMTLITQARAFGLAGCIVFSMTHWFCDAVWLTVLSQLAYRGGRFFGKRFQQVVFVVCGAALLAFGVKFLVDAVL